MKTIKIKGEIYEACEAFPSIYEFKDEGGNDYYFRYRSSKLTLNKNGNLVFTYRDDSDDFGGYMSWEECCLICYSVTNVFINDSEVTNENYTIWLESELMNEVFKSLEEE